jgi:glutamine synthetase
MLAYPTVEERLHTEHAAVEAFLMDQGVHTVIAAFADHPGVVRGKRVPTAQFLRSLDTGVAFCKAVLGWDIQGGLLDGIPWASFDSGYPDFVARPDPDTLRLASWHEGTAFVLSDLYTEHGDIVDAAPRQVLKRVVDRVIAAGYVPKVGAELEFYLTDADGRPAFEGVQCYSVEHATLVEGVLGAVRGALLAAGVEVEASGTEYGPGQAEITFAYGDALAVADTTVFFKWAVREIARVHGLRATFMAKPLADQSGNGFHVHQSLWSLDGRTNAFAADRGLAESYVAGLLRTARDFQLLSAPTVNSYKRIQAQSFAPTNATWGFDNRTAATRAFFDVGSASRIEHRTGAADANPYLIIAANLAGGLRGISEDLVPPPPVGRDAAVVNAVALPRDLAEAVEVFKTSELARDAFGADFHHAYSTLGRHELAVWNAAVTDWERSRYFDLA